MKRLLNLLASGMNSRVYEGPMTVVWNDNCPPTSDHSPVYYDDRGVGYEFSRTNKREPLLPTIVVQIPVALLGVYETTRFEDETIQAAAADFLLREFGRFFDEPNSELENRARPVEENGRFYVYKPGGEVLKRNSAFFSVLPAKDYRNAGGTKVCVLPEGEIPPHRLCFCVRIQVQLPVKSDAKTLKKVARMLCTVLPRTVSEFIDGFDREKLLKAVELARLQAAIRAEMAEKGIVAFVADGAILPRQGDSELPMVGALPFHAPGELDNSLRESDAVALAGVRGLGIRAGVTVITGGGYSGKSTLLDAIAAGIYDHCSGDGRELVLTDPTAVEIAAEDGRSVQNDNISAFIRWLPGGDPSDFSTSHASGSTSQAANIVEAIDFGAKLLLIDEDRSATNFMIRDELMKKLIAREPITPFTDRVNQLAKRGISTILVIGGSGEYLSVADRVYLMDEYVLKNVTNRARELAGRAEIVEDCASFTQLPRLVDEKFTSYPEIFGGEKLEFSETGFILVGREQIDVRVLAGLATFAQANMVGFLLRAMMNLCDDRFEKIKSAPKRLDALIDSVYELVENEGLDAVYSGIFENCPRFFDLPRKIEIRMAVARMRFVQIE